MNYQDRVKQYDALFGKNPNSAAAKFWLAWKPQYLKGFEKMGGFLASSAPDPMQIDLTQFNPEPQLGPMPTLEPKDIYNLPTPQGTLDPFANDPVLQHFVNPKPATDPILGNTLIGPGINAFMFQR